MNELFERLTGWMDSRSPRERWLVVLVLCVAGALLVQLVIVSPLRAQLQRVERRNESLETQVMASERMAREIRVLQSDLESVEARIKPGEKTNLFTLLERLAAEASIKDQLESIKPKQPSGNQRYPETRVEVSLKGATLKQTVQFLHKIESAPVLLIMRSLRVKSRNDSPLLDVSFSVSSFERA